MFYLAVRAFVVDITEDEDRTARLAFADAVHSIGTIIGIPTETYMKKLLGFIPLFSINLLLCILTIIYSTVYVQDSYHLLPLLKKEVFDEERKKGEKHHKEGKNYLASLLLLLSSSRDHQWNFYHGDEHVQECVSEEK